MATNPKAKPITTTKGAMVIFVKEYISLVPIIRIKPTRTRSILKINS